jgi:hypothetical protein
MRSSVKKLWLKYEYHTLEFEETQTEFDKRKAEFESAFRERYKKLPVSQKSVMDSVLSDDPSNMRESPALQSTPHEKDTETHTLFKEIAKHTHPDKHATRDEQTRLEKAVVFKRAKSLAEKGDWFGLYAIAQELGIEVDPPGEEECQQIEATIGRMHNKAQAMLKTAAWTWYDLDSVNRAKYMEAYYVEVLRLHEETHT